MVAAQEGSDVLLVTVLALGEKAMVGGIEYS
jgi:hypothetical protein